MVDGNGATSSAKAGEQNPGAESVRVSSVARFSTDPQRDPGTESVPVQPGIGLQPYAGEGSMSRRDKQSLVMAFGAGSRTCIGRSLALVEMTAFIAELVKGYDMEVCGAPKKMYGEGVMPVPTPPLMVKLKPRVGLNDAV